MIDYASGRYINYARLAPHDVDFDDIAQGLGSTIRFRGQTSRLISVAEHALRVERFGTIIAELYGVDDHHVAVCALHHDDHEAYMPWGDCPGPYKTDAMREAEAAVQAVIWEAIGWAPSEQVQRAVKAADAAALYYEAALWSIGGTQWCENVWPAEITESFKLRLLGAAHPKTGETLTEAVSTGRWWGEAWARRMTELRPPQARPVLNSKMLSGERRL